MNVFGKNERSWRKARKRGVSPIIATILLVAITVVLAAVLYVLISGLTGGGVGSKPIGTAFNAGNPILASPSAGTLANAGCLGGASGTGHYCYTLTVESSTINFGQVQFEVKTSTGAIYTAVAAGGFSVLNIAQAVVAQTVAGAGTGLAMSSTLAITAAGTAAGITTASPLTNLYTIVIDLGLVTGGVSPSGTGLTFVGLGTGGFSGTTSPVALP